MQIHDVIVVGAGPAGLSAALMLGRARRDVLVLDDGRPRNRFADHVHGVLGHEGAPPRALADRGRAEIEAYGARLAVDRVERVVDAGDGIEVRTAGGETRRARALVVATGIADELPEVPGLAERWGTTVLHCPYCHGWEVRDRRLGLLPTSPASLHLGELLRQWSEAVTVFANGIELDAARRARLAARGVRVVDAPVVALLGDGAGLDGVRTADGAEHAIDALFTSGVPRPHDGFLAGLDLARENGLLAVDERGQTSHGRIWAAGNVVLPAANVPLSMGLGSMAGAAVNAALVEWEFDAAAHPHVSPAEPWPVVAPADYWEERYRGDRRIWSGAVNATLAAVAADLVPGTAVDLGCGEGADALWLAAHGWAVIGVDISATAVRRASEAAADAGLGDRVRFERADLSAWDAPAPVHLVTASFFHSTVELPREDILRRATGWVAPGGHLLVVSHAAPPPWAAGHHHAELPTPDDDLRMLGLDAAQWEVVLAEVRTRRVTAPDGSEASLDDGVVLARRR